MSDSLQFEAAASSSPESTGENTANPQPNGTSQHDYSGQTDRAVRKDNTGTTVENETEILRSREQRSHPKDEDKAVETDKDVEKGPPAGEKPEPTEEAPKDPNLVRANSMAL